MRPTARTTALEIPSKGGILASPAPIGTKLPYAEAGRDHVPSLMQEDDSETRANVPEKRGTKETLLGII